MLNSRLWRFILLRNLQLYGQLGTGSTSTPTSPQLIDLGINRTAISVSFGQYHTCAILDDGQLKCWGNNYNGQVGIGTSGFGSDVLTPTLIDLGIGRTVVSVSLGTSHTCAILDNGQLKCWGDNIYGQLGIGSTVASSTPQAVDLGVGRTAISVSSGQYHTCAILDDYSLSCWGYNYEGQLGLGTSNTFNYPTTCSFNVWKNSGFNKFWWKYFMFNL